MNMRFFVVLLSPLFAVSIGALSVLACLSRPPLVANRRSLFGTLGALALAVVLFPVSYGFAPMPW